MPRMISLPRISRLALALALVVPATAHASELTPEQMAWYRAQMGLAAQSATPPSTSSVGDAVLEWRRLTANNIASFDQLSRFLMANRGWPDAEKLRVRAEKAIALDSYDPQRTLAFFQAYPPRTASGELRLALALNATGRRDEANAAARRAWTGGIIDDMEVSRALGFFSGAFSPADHDARMDRLLWTGSTIAAGRQLTYTSPEKRAIFAARLAMRGGAVDAALQSAAVESANPSLLRTDAGYITDKATWLRKSGRVGEARALLAAPRALAKAPTDTEEWLETLLTNARAADAAGDKQTAFNIAKQIDDSFAPGVVIREAPLSVRDDFTSLAWLAGQLAYKDLRRPAEAVRLYRAYGEAARSAQTRTKGFYWAGRAALAAGDRDTANRYFADAAEHYDQFYGQLSLERLDRPQPRPKPEPTIHVSSDQKRAFEDDRLVRAARALGEIGAWREQSQFLRALAQRASSPADHVLAGQLASSIGRPDLGVMIGRSAQANSLDAVEVSGFPTVRVPSGHESNWTFIHAITRQESQFDRQAISHAGARGMMQLMPGTAREVAGKLGLGYDAGSLTADTNYNMTLGSTYFQQMLSYFGGSYPLAVAAYNAGPGNVNKWLRANGDPRGGGIDMVDWIEAIPIFETRNYVQRVLENAVVYDTLRDGRSVPKAPLSFYLGKRDPG
ncbi:MULTISPECIES: lytic transglycosylase domain-containing protein [unclassified Sphingopyxis]|uniref:lytic transglycosylase domain-containing protein n=2 Tax=Sphingopyxis TaxID=165697 RepID=UPI00072FD6A1|nr:MULTISPECIES: lytic transglycosylase domain-containing protein [unclassified Sphingopyxis]KTE56381.1 lytic transglycosylase [Sphingopyxis sp. H071]KTE67419.1 lytic transglycosylase [Sphingopyxis sp. H081]KTE25219.1 lytic transglycosylase [Sphingopyxis sp. H057]KTE53789.1 lytic transglycosylase [Sphingopyxis sp. H073]KTE55948.1 lytic transglycosylase [Sphingopyxis sp. H107]